MILALIDHDLGTPDGISFEMLTFARELAAALGQPLEAILVGERARPLADRLTAYGVSKSHLVRHERLVDFAPEAWAHGVQHLIETLQPRAILGPGTDRGNEVMAHLAARIELPLATNCVAFEAGERLRLTRQRWGGSLLEEALLAGEPKLLTVAAHVLAAEEVTEAGEAAVNEVTAPLDERDFRVRVTGRSESEAEGISLADARIVIGGGRGVGSLEGFALLDELAEVLEGAVGSSRAATNLGWRAHADQIGQTGTRIAPDLYIACGISGAIQHMVGCKGAKKILSINTDPEAPIVAKANYAVIGDLHEVIPALINELQKQ